MSMGKENDPGSSISLERSVISGGCEFAFEEISLKVDKKYILNRVSGFAKPGEILAIMGPSGAGKTSLLNCLAGRKSLESGEIRMNSKVLDKQLKRKISYVLQKDIFLSNLTCWQTIWYTALLRLPGSMPTAEKRKKVQEIVDVLDMNKCLNTVIGNDMLRGLSGGEKKRTSIACELLTNPELMLLDEPTSGLDSSTAFSLCSALKSYAKITGKTVIITIHQPSSQIFNMFDTLLLLCEGQVAYYGEVKTCAEYFCGLNLPCPPNYNLADHIVDQVKQSKEKADFIIHQAAIHREKVGYSAMQNVNCLESGSSPTTEIGNHVAGNTDEDVISNGQINPSFEKDIELGDSDESITSNIDQNSHKAIKYERDYNSKWPTSFWLQYSVLTRRSFRQARPRVWNKWSFIQHILIALYSGIVWFQLPSTEEKLRDRFGFMYYLFIHLAFLNAATALASPPEERATLNKERLGGYYRLSSYCLARVTVDLSINLLLPIIFVTISFWMAGINHNFWTYLQFIVTIALSVIAARSVGGIFGAMILEMQAAMVVNLATVVAVLISGGFFTSSIPFWADWVKYLVFSYYAYNALLISDLSTASIECAALNSQYHSCADNMTEVVTSDDPIRYISTSELLTTNVMLPDGMQRWHCIVILIAMTTVMQTSIYIILRCIRKPKLA